MNLSFAENTLANGNLVARYILQSLGEFDLRDDLRRVTCPTLVLHGDADPMPVAYAEEIHRLIPGSELRILGRSGHWIFVDATDRFCSAVNDFVDGIGDR
jgi:pimeloyl-ACP methyl ester carboxylesterase